MPSSDADGASAGPGSGGAERRASPLPCAAERRASLRCAEAAAAGGEPAGCAPHYNAYKACMKEAAAARAAARPGLLPEWLRGGGAAGGAAGGT